MQKVLKIVPVLDLLGGVAVRGVAGRREEYRPLRSNLAASSHPLEIARALRDRLRLQSLYVADLDAILFRRPDYDLYRQLIDEGFTLLVDAGLRERREAEALLATGAGEAIAGLETIPGPAFLGELVCRFGPEQITFSLDLSAGRPLGDLVPWQTDDPLEIAQRAYAEGVRQMIVLDLAAVGVNSGVPTLELCRRVAAHCPDVRLTTGGGVRDPADVQAVLRAGAEQVLVASALHDGRIGRADIEAVQSAEKLWPAP